MIVAPHILRRYVIAKASGRTPRAEWAYYAPDIGAWVRADETSARSHEHHHRIRKAGLPWCDALGHRTDIYDNLALQVYFLTVNLEDWPRHAAAVRKLPKRCLCDWTATGSRIIAAVMPDVAPVVSRSDGLLVRWPKGRGTGQRSLLPH